MGHPVPSPIMPALPATATQPRDRLAGAAAAPAGPDGAAALPPVRVVAFPANSRQNPHMRLLYGALAAHGVSVLEGSVRTLARADYDLVHVHWPERLLNRSLLRRWRGLARFLVDVALLRAKGARLVWTVHNIKGHEERRGAASRIFRRVLFRNLGGFISLSHTAHRLTLETYPALRDKPSLVAPRGHYRDLYPDPPARRAARAALGLPADALVIGLIGLVRPYKNIPHLLRCASRLDRADLRLLVAGECTDPALAAELSALAAADPRVHLQLRFVPEEELAAAVRALDLTVLPYRDILNSGSALLALSLDVPVLAPALGTLTEVREAVGQEWVRTYTGELDEQELGRALEWAAQRREGRAPLGYFDWERNATATARFFRSILGRAPDGAVGEKSGTT